MRPNSAGFKLPIVKELSFKLWKVINTGIHRLISILLCMAIVLFNS